MVVLGVSIGPLCRFFTYALFLRSGLFPVKQEHGMVVSVQNQIAHNKTLCQYPLPSASKGHFGIE